jgi:hypothetical protein
MLVNQLLQTSGLTHVLTVTFRRLSSQTDVSDGILSWVIDIECSPVLISCQHPESRWEFVDWFVTRSEISWVYVGQRTVAFGSTYSVSTLLCMM